MITFYDIHVTWQATLSSQYTTLHGHFVVNVGMLALGQLFTPLLFDDFERERFHRGLVLADDHRGEITLAEGAVRVRRFVGSYELLDGGRAWFLPYGFDILGRWVRIGSK